MKTTSAANCDLPSAINAARAYTAIAKSYFSDVPQEGPAAEQFIQRTRGAFTAASSNLAFSIELQLKAEAIRCKHAMLHTHYLDLLFDHLPVESKRKIESSYDACVRSVGSSILSIEVAVTRTPIQPRDEDLKAARGLLTKVENLRTLLVAERDAFETWRYFFSEGPVGPVLLVESHFRRMLILTDVLDAHIRSG